MECSEIKEQLDALYQCRPTDEGLRVATSCVYPSFSQVFVYINRIGKEYVVRDGGGAASVAWDHGRDDPLIKKILAKEALKFRVDCEGLSLVAKVKSADWLPAAIMAVANASSLAAHSIVDHVVAATESDIATRIFRALLKVYPEPKIKREFVIEGGSGKQHRFDFAVGDIGKRLVLLDAITPHHSSIAHKYTAFADVKPLLNGTAQSFAVFERRLDNDDAALIQQVACLVPISSVSEGTLRALSA
jgi:hypothetical protein